MAADRTTWYFLQDCEAIAGRPHDIAGLARVLTLAMRGLEHDDCEMNSDRDLLYYLANTLDTVTWLAALPPEERWPGPATPPEPRLHLVTREGA